MVLQHGKRSRSKGLHVGIAPVLGLLRELPDIGLVILQLVFDIGLIEILTGELRQFIDA